MKIIVYIEYSDNKIHPVALEALAIGQKLKKQSNGELHALIFNNNLANNLKEYNIDSILSISNPNLTSYIGTGKIS